MDAVGIHSTVFAIVLVKGPGIEPRGTGFLLNKPGLIATASHVVGRSGEKVGVIINEISSIDDYQHAVRNEAHYYTAEIIAFDPVHDLAILNVPALSGFVNSSLVITGGDQVSVGHDVVSFGYPHFNGGRKVLTRFDAKIGAKILLPSLAEDVKYLVLNTFARPGQSGAPVFHSETNELVAVLSGAYQPPNQGVSIMIGGADLSAMSQTTHIVSAEYLRGMY
jgi:S1-C subfamily serine protease